MPRLTHLAPTQLVKASDGAAPSPSCVEYYRRIRLQSSAGAEQIGSGRNLFPPSPDLVETLSGLSRAFLHSERAVRYDSSHDAELRRVVAALVNTYLGTSIYDHDDVFFINGSTEGIAIIADYCALAGNGYLFPLPCYFAYEDSAVRRGESRFAYYAAGHSTLSGDLSQRSYCAYVNNPCAISGRAVLPGLPAPRPADLTVCDFVHQMQDLGASNSRAAARELAGAAPDSTALLFTVSKDLSLPGLRAGALLTKCSRLRDYARDVQFERYYTPSPLIGLSMATYLALLNLSYDPESLATVQGALATHPLLATLVSSDLPATFERHRQRMLAHYRRGVAVVLEYDDLFPAAPDQIPNAGYSCLLSVNGDIGADAELADFATFLSTEHDIKINPSLMFGGDLDSWQALYGSAAGIRVNVSIPLPRLRAQLDGLRRAARGYRSCAAMSVSRPGNVVDPAPR